MKAVKVAFYMQNKPQWQNLWEYLPCQKICFDTKNDIKCHLCIILDICCILVC